MARRMRLTVAYDGAGFHGFAENHDVRTVMGVLRQTIETVLQTPVHLVGAGRTDAGVHGWGQVVSGDLPETVDLAVLARRINRMCSPAVVVRDIAWAADPQFSARFSAQWRHYRYLVLNSPFGVPSLAASAWHVSAPLDLPALQLACDPLIGEHDFTSFCRKPRLGPDEAEARMSRRVMIAAWHREPHPQTDSLLRFEIRANAFCHQMVRSIVGMMIDVGLGRVHAGDVRGILLARSRTNAGQVAPAHALTLWEVGYPAE
jgi:tRNA pseudouridine38-40 synthase